MKIYIISDTHFNHKRIAEFCQRPENHEELMLNALMKIPQDSCLIHLGDFSLGNEAKYCAKLNQHFLGRKILVRGNHDSKSLSFYMEHGWDFVCNSIILEYAGERILFSHIPQIWDSTWDVNVHGHLHNLDHRKNEFINTLRKWHRLYAPELFEYQPIELAKFIQSTVYETP